MKGARTYHPEWLDDPKVVERMLHRLARCDLFANVRTERDSLVEKLNVPVEVANQSALLEGLGQLSAVIEDCIAVSEALSRVAFGSAQDILWAYSELDAMGRHVDSRGNIVAKATRAEVLS